jgi:hypothetical protein
LDVLKHGDRPIRVVGGCTNPIRHLAKQIMFAMAEVQTGDVHSSGNQGLD